MSKRTYYEVYWVESGSKWCIRQQGSSTNIECKSTKEAAVDRGVEIAKNNRPSELVIKNKDGTISDRRTYNGDPEHRPG